MPAAEELPLSGQPVTYETGGDGTATVSAPGAWKSVSLELVPQPNRSFIDERHFLCHLPPVGG